MHGIFFFFFRFIDFCAFLGYDFCGGGGGGISEEEKEINGTD